MAQRTDTIRRTASGNCDVVRFDVVDATHGAARLPDNLPSSDVKRSSKFVGVHYDSGKKIYKGKTYIYHYWKAKVHLGDGKFKHRTRKTPTDAALAYDNMIKEYGLNKTTNYDLYGEYWK